MRQCRKYWGGMKRSLLFLALLAAAAGLVGWRALSLRKAPAATASALRVVATFYPLGDFASHVGGNLVDVKVLVPPGGEPHDYEPTPQDLVAAHDAQVVLMNGGVDAWLDRVVPDLRASGVRVMRVQDAFPSIGKDPHVWLVPDFAEQIVGMILGAFVAADPAHAETYRANATAYIAQLDALDESYHKGLASCATRTVVASHDALGYMAEHYQLTIIPIAGLSPDEEPSPKRMAEVAALAKAGHAKTIFFETLVSPKLAQTIAQEIGVTTSVFDPVEGLTPDELAAGKDYLSLMRQNLEALRSALTCS